MNENTVSVIGGDRRCRVFQPRAPTRNLAASVQVVTEDGRVIAYAHVNAPNDGFVLTPAELRSIRDVFDAAADEMDREINRVGGHDL